MMPNEMAKRIENNHDELNLGQILFMVPTEFKKMIRKLEKAHTVFINNKYGIIFNETYNYIHTYFQLHVFSFVLYFFTGTILKTQKLRMCRSQQSNSLQNDVSYSRTGQKLLK